MNNSMCNFFLKCPFIKVEPSIIQAKIRKQFIMIIIKSEAKVTSFKRAKIASIDKNISSKFKFEAYLKNYNFILN